MSQTEQFDIKPQSIYMRKWRKENPDKVKANNKRNYWRHHQRSRTRAKECKDRLRESIFGILGHICVQCGYSDKRALQFDHINGNGSVEVAMFKGNSKMLRYYRDNPVDCKNNIQVLCANCNWIKKHENNEVTKKAYKFTP